MENKINIAKFLKNCPEGMKLNCTVRENLYFKEVTNSEAFPISCYFEQNGVKIPQYFTKYGCYHSNDNAKCVIFPKDKTTWKEFIAPVMFKDGDVVALDVSGSIELFIFNKWENQKKGLASCYLTLYDNDKLDLEHGIYYINRLATEEEKQRLFKTIRERGYKWNAKTKTLQKLIFDISTLKPFDKVLVRSFNCDIWECDFFSSYNPNCTNKFHCVGAWYDMCIPYIGNEHLRGTSNDCIEFYKIWED